jgi:hypothetical protein
MERVVIVIQQVNRGKGNRQQNYKVYLLKHIHTASKPCFIAKIFDLCQVQNTGVFFSLTYIFFNVLINI